jgi:tRNA A37 threonylcarbamoyladenosine biosynthesis protein TsaE
MYEMIHNSRATVYSSGFFCATLTSPQSTIEFTGKIIDTFRDKPVYLIRVRVDLPGGKTVLVTSYGLHLNTEGRINSETF